MTKESWGTIAVFPQDTMTSPSPSQFGSNLYGQPSGMGSLSIQQRSMSNAPFQRNVTPTSMPTSMSQNFPLGLQPPQQQQQQQQQPQQPPQLPPQQVSPNRYSTTGNLFSSFNNMSSTMGSTMGSNIGSTMGSNIGSSMGSSMGTNLGSSMGSSMGSSIGSSMGSNIGSTMGSSMGTNLGSTMGSSMGTNLGSTMGSSMGTNIGSSMTSQRGILNTMPGQLSSQLKRPSPASSGLISSTSNTVSNMTLSMSSLSAFPRTNADGSQPNLDLSEFPTLGNRAPPNPLPAVRNYGMVSKPVQDPTPEFQIQQEDFPALPGAQNPPTSSSSDIARKTMAQPFELQPTTSSTTPGPYDQALKDMKFPSEKMNSGSAKRGIQTHPDGTVSNLPAGMVMDQFGMVGLLTFIRAAEIDPNLVALAPGIDLTTLGLNLNSPENLYNTFQSPWADAPCRPQDIDFHVPTEYLTNMFIRDKLAPIKLNRYGEDLLFFLFFMNGGDVLQLAAAAELHNRDWRYHKEERVWITRAPGMEPAVKTNTYERGTYYYFDVQNWRKVHKEFHLEYDKLEERPILPHFGQE